MTSVAGWSPMDAASLSLVLLVLALTFVLPRTLAAAAWPSRAPQPALVLWQAAGLAGGLSAIGAGLLLATAPLPGGALSGVYRLARDAAAGRPLAGLDAPAVLGLLGAAALASRLLWVLLSSSWRTVAARRRHRSLVDLLATPWPSLGGARVLDHPRAVAYCLPGLRPRVVLSAGVLALLAPAEVEAVLAHEQAHLRQRHDLVVLPFVALGATFPRLGGVLLAQEQVAVLVEMLADDRAARLHGAGVLASALVRVGSSPVPGSALGVSGSPVAVRVARLLDPPVPAGVGLRTGVHLASVLLVLLPVALVALS